LINSAGRLLSPRGGERRLREPFNRIWYEAKKERLGFQTGVRESAQSRKEWLVDLKARSVSIGPEVAAGAPA
jgi:hypothetical protein